MADMRENRMIWCYIVGALSLRRARVCFSFHCQIQSHQAWNGLVREQEWWWENKACFNMYLIFKQLTSQSLSKISCLGKVQAKSVWPKDKIQNKLQRLSLSSGTSHLHNSKLFLQVSNKFMISKNILLLKFG